MTVSLSGDGGDELFAGYNRYAWSERIWPYVRRIPGPARRAFSGGVGLLSPDRWESVAQTVEKVLPRRLRMSIPGDKLYKLARAVHVDDIDSFYDSLLGRWNDPACLLSDAIRPHEPSTEGPAGLPFVHRMMYRDQLDYLPDDLLAKVDRTSMGVSLEVRVPILDHEVVGFAWSLPRAMILRNGTSKWLLRKVLERHVPARLFERPKMGFSVPIDAWLRGPLRAWGEEMLDEARLRRQGFLNPEPIRRAWQDHQHSRANMQYALWNVLMFQAWLP